MAEAPRPDDGHPGDDHTVRPYRIVDTRTRRRAGIAYIVMAGLGAWIVVAAGVEAMWLTAVVPIVALAVYEFAGAWSMPIGDMRAIEIAGESASFGVGHGSATLGYRGVLARPVWQVLVFSDTPTPDRQALVTVDAISGEVTGRYEESVDLP